MRFHHYLCLGTIEDAIYGVFAGVFVLALFAAPVAIAFWYSRTKDRLYKEKQEIWLRYEIAMHKKKTSFDLLYKKYQKSPLDQTLFHEINQSASAYNRAFDEVNHWREQIPSNVWVALANWRLHLPKDHEGSSPLPLNDFERISNEALSKIKADAISRKKAKEMRRRNELQKEAKRKAAEKEKAERVKAEREEAKREAAARKEARREEAERKKALHDQLRTWLTEFKSLKFRAMTASGDYELFLNDLHDRLKTEEITELREQLTSLGIARRDSFDQLITTDWCSYLTRKNEAWPDLDMSEKLRDSLDTQKFIHWPIKYGITSIERIGNPYTQLLADVLSYKFDTYSLQQDINLFFPTTNETESPSLKSHEQRLKKAKELLDGGMISKEEYEGKRKDILDSI